MVVRTYYVMVIENIHESEDVVRFMFNNLSEVKQFMKKIDDVTNVDGQIHYDILLYKVEYAWNLTTGAVTRTETQVTAEF